MDFKINFYCFPKIPHFMKLSNIFQFHFTYCNILFYNLNNVTIIIDFEEVVDLRFCCRRLKKVIFNRLMTWKDKKTRTSEKKPWTHYSTFWGKKCFLSCLAFWFCPPPLNVLVLLNWNWCPLKSGPKLRGHFQKRMQRAKFRHFQGHKRPAIVINFARCQLKCLHKGHKATSVEVPPGVSLL